MFVARMTLRRSLGRRATLLVLGGERPVQGQDEQVLAPGQRLEPHGGAADLLGPGQEDEDVAGVVRARQDLLHRRDDRLGSGRTSRRTIGDLDRERPPLDAQHRAVAQEPRDRPGVHRGRHDDQDQVVADRLPDLAQQGQGQVGVQAPLVELVEHHRADAFEEWVVRRAGG